MQGYLKEAVAIIEIGETMRIRIMRDYAKKENAYTTETSVESRFQVIEHEYDNLADAWAYVTGKVMLAKEREEK